MKCTYDPIQDKNTAMGMFHCPECGEMVLAGVAHPQELTADEEAKWLEDRGLDDYYMPKFEGNLWVYRAENQAREEPAHTKYGPDDMDIEYDLDPVIAQRIYDMYYGKAGMFKHSYRAIARSVIGWEDQKGGEDLVRLASKTLGKGW